MTLSRIRDVPPHRARRSLAVAVALLISGTSTATASAGPLVEAAAGCTAPALSQPFARWLDPARYALVPDGAVEQRAAGWELSGGAAPVAGSEPFAVHDSRDRSSLSLPAGSSATTAPVCVGLSEPTLRFFARRAAGAGLLSTLKVEVLFEDAGGTVRAAQIGSDLGGGWHPTAVMPILVNLLPLLSGEQIPVAFRFTPSGGGDWQIDDVYYDPWVMR
jgi:hypothetical protein